jgi:DNA-binding FadR family transcriptional regulator
MKRDARVRQAEPAEPAPAQRPSRRVTIKRISAPKPYDVLADQLRETILRGEISEGDSLPTERELVSQTGLTRGSVREALRTLASEGLIQTRHGRLGGNVVTLPGNDTMAGAIARFVRGRRLSLRSLQETREALEPLLARLAAQRRSGADLQELKRLHEDLIASAGNFQQFAHANVEWHNAVAKASGNELLAALLYSVSYGLHVATMTEEYDTPDTRKAVIRIHSRINEAIEAGNADLAERRMREHLGATHARTVSRGAMEIPLSEDR